MFAIRNQLTNAILKRYHTYNWISSLLSNGVCCHLIMRSNRTRRDTSVDCTLFSCSLHSKIVDYSISTGTATGGKKPARCKRFRTVIDLRVTAPRYQGFCAARRQDICISDLLSGRQIDCFQCDMQSCRITTHSASVL